MAFKWGVAEGGVENLLRRPADRFEITKEMRNKVYRSLSGALVEPEQVLQLNLDNSNLKSLPTEIGQLKNLTEHGLGGNNLSDKAKREIKQLLPSCNISF